MPYPAHHAQFFDASQLPAASPAYVVWIDVMGVQATLSRSIMIAANFVGKLHAAVQQTPHGGIELFPVMDGVFATTTSQAALFQFIPGVFERLAATFVHTPDHKHRFLSKAAIAYGPTIAGSAIPAAASQVLAASPDYRDSILLGMPMVQAFRGERLAPPFGVFVDESARAFAPTGLAPIPHAWWRWYQPGQDAQHLRDELDAYFQWCSGRSASLLYARERLDEHRDLAAQYFADA